MVKISAVIITFNEERNIERCLLSLKGMVDEIIVVDSFSTDNTGAICDSQKVRFIQHAFEGYARQKLWASQQASNDHILSLDADEALSMELQKSITAVKNNWQADGYVVSRLTNYMGKWIRHCGWYPDAKLRLWDRRKGNWSGINLHEKVQMTENSKIRKLEGDLLHYSYYSIEQHINKLNKYSDIAAQEALQRGKKSSLLIAITRSAWRFKRDYFFKLGIFDGYYGFIICAINACTTFSKYIKICELKKKSVV
jgi:glycosyltransferase involved in cell wall biosynthesis